MQIVKGLIKNSTKMEQHLKVMVTLFFLGWNVIEGAVFENEYPYIFVKLYPTPIWRLLLLIALIAGSMWDPYVGIMMAFATFFYAMDMEVTLDKWN